LTVSSSGSCLIFSPQGGDGRLPVFPPPDGGLPSCLTALVRFFVGRGTTLSCSVHEERTGRPAAGFFLAPDDLVTTVLKVSPSKPQLSFSPLFKFLAPRLHPLACTLQRLSPGAYGPCDCGRPYHSTYPPFWKKIKCVFPLEGPFPRRGVPGVSELLDHPFLPQNPKDGVAARPVYVFGNRSSRPHGRSSTCPLFLQCLPE